MKYLDETGAAHLVSKVKAASDCTLFTIAVASWSTATTTVNGTAYYTYVIPLTAVNASTPDIMVGYATTDDLPTADQQSAYDLIKYGVADSTALTLTLYAESLPTVAFYIKVRGVT